MSTGVQTLPKPPIPDGPLLSELAGMPAARAWGEGLAKDLALYKAGRLKWQDIDAGVVLHGPPGTGKTTVARAIAATARVPLIATSYADWNRSCRYLTDIINGMQRAFQTARENAPCVMAIDELDSLPDRSSLAADQQSFFTIVNALLEELNGLNARPGVVVIGICNNPGVLDPALVRAGRLGRSILVPVPSMDALPQIFRFHLGEDAASVADLSSIAVMCVGMSGADVEQLVRDAKQRSRRDDRPLAHSDLLAIIQARTAGRDPRTEWRIALHEAGHAVAARRRRLSSSITVSIVGAQGSAGRMIENAVHTAATRETIEAQLSVLLAGRAAEEVCLGTVSGGAGGDRESDLARATQLAFDAIGKLGLSTSLPPMWFGTDLERMRAHRAVGAEAADMLATAYESARELIRAEMGYVEAIGKELIKRKALTHDDITALDPTSDPLSSLKALLGAAAKIKK